MRHFFYLKSKQEFVREISGHMDDFIYKMREGAFASEVFNVGEEEKSWKNNANELSSLLKKCNVPNDVMIGFEYLVPISGRIDCVLMGHGVDGQKNMIHVELKQWSNNNVDSYYDGYSVAVKGYKSGEKVCAHPSAQAAEYQTHLENYLVALEQDTINLIGMAYCYNYESCNNRSVLFSDSFKDLLTICPLYCKDTKDNLIQKLENLLGGGKGEEIVDSISNSDIRPTKRLQDAAIKMFDGNKESQEFALLGAQLDAYNAILGAIKNTDKDHQKTVIIVKGGPGTGKSVIAMRLVSGLAKLGNYPNVYYSTRSSSLRNGYKKILQNINYKAGASSNCIDLIKNNIDFRPGMFGGNENAVDALIVDEAHRISHKANDQTDKDKSKQTYLTQIMAMLYTARVSVFFIDDKQGIEKKEIGKAQSIKAAANSYYSRILSETAEYKKEYAKIDDKIKKKERKLAELEYAGESDEKIRTAEKTLISLQKEKEVGLNWCDDVQPHVKEVNVIEFELEDQFRCNGSNNYLDWIDNVFSNEKHDVTTAKLDRDMYEFEVFDTPQELYQKVRQLDDYASWADKCANEMKDNFSYKALKERKNEEKPVFKQSARMVAGYCWAWDVKQTQENGDLLYEVNIPAYDFSMPWETQATPKGDFAYKYAKNADCWASQDEGVNQIGCVYSVQGWEMDYIGVIIGPDVIYDKENDCLKSDPTQETHNVSKDKTVHDRLIKDIYRVLMTRGMKGCYVFACDPGVREYLRRLMK